MFRNLTKNEIDFRTYIFGQPASNYEDI